MFADKFVDLDIIANAILLFSAGADTVSITTSFCLYELALKRDIQDKLRAEINQAKKKYDGKFTNDFLLDLQYAEMVLNGKYWHTVVFFFIIVIFLEFRLVIDIIEVGRGIIYFRKLFSLIKEQWCI